MATMSRKWLLLIVAALLVIAFSIAWTASNKVKIAVIRLLPTTESIPREYGIPGKTDWKPMGEKRISSSNNPNARQVTIGRALHTDTHGSDEISTVFAPAFAVDWTVEQDMFITEGPVFDSAGNIYFCPILNNTDVMLVSIEPEKGERRWALEGFSFGCGTPYVLIDPETGKDVIYLGTYDRAMAVTTEGEVIWDVPTGLPPLDRNIMEPPKHSFGMNYIASYDAVIASMGDGSVYVLDRKTGRPLLDKPYVMPGAKAPVNNFTLPENVARKANQDAAHMFGGYSDDFDILGAVLHGAAGEKQKVTNFFSVDSNSGRVWIAATLPDEADGSVDGWAESAALYGLDLVRQGDRYTFKINSVTEVPGGTASTPTISADGKRIYIANAFDTVYAVDASNGDVIWSKAVGNKVTGSLVVAADNSEIYANTKSDIVKLFDRGDRGEIAWFARLDMFKPGLFQQNFNVLGAELGANGLTFTATVGVLMGKMRFPYKVGAGFIDRETGDIKYFVEGGEDSVSSTVTGPDGALYIGNSPLRRVLTRVILGEDKSPQSVMGGITKYKPIYNELIVRDALWAAAGRARNAATLNNPAVVEQDVFQINQLLDQALRALPVAHAEGRISQPLYDAMQRLIKAEKETITSDSTQLLAMADKLETLTDQF
ncbi:PQQ-binding-like beta-propeller repeat protein [Kistimonas asteriae]|uniref:outer membrane protein assembly factor BamB family protein n=1 Tax=Kistimonas asteriae TaxID=517724 RepID=UPI001BA48B7B|nr:PQQ-binding-like beta-propeller repeat protein [Kistimonas asteriae]